MAERKFRELFEDMTASRLKLPPMFRVYLLNDDYTTMDFVVTVLETIFHKTAAEATQIMLHVHKQGSGLCGVYTRDIAETKVAHVREVAEKNDFPLMCMMEEE